MSLKEEILGLADRKVEEVDVPEWGRKVRIMEMTAADRDDWETRILAARQAGQSRRHVRAELVAMCLVDEVGARVFADDDIPALSQKSAAVLDRLWDVASRLSGLTRKEAENIAKN
jgi:hypothetical protein